MNFTSAQQQAISAPGNVLVVAGAGTGKTRTLVERCLSLLSSPVDRVSLDEMLIVTFTEAAAAEMRSRIRGRIEEQLQPNPNDPWWNEQLALFEAANIGTLHSFCLRLVREHFYQLEIDPQVAVMSAEESRLLVSETLTRLFQGHYEGRASGAEAVQKLIQVQGQGSDDKVRGLLLRIHEYTQTLPDPSAWLAEQEAMFANAEPVLWRNWLNDAVTEWQERWRPVLEESEVGNPTAKECLHALRELSSAPLSAARVANALSDVLSAAGNYPRGKRKTRLEPLAGFITEARFLSSLLPVNGGNDPLVEDWACVRSDMATLLRLSREFSEAYAAAKRELGILDFHDLEQFALRLLWDFAEDGPTEIAQHWRRKLRHIFVDEYQDINAAQDRIIQALGRSGAEANRFLVGDVKQSIYRFRLANPRIFQEYIRDWRGAAGTSIALTENFRSDPRILTCVNALFADLMQQSVGGVTYDETAMLKPGDGTGALNNGAAEPCVEIHWRLKGAVAEKAADNSDQQSGIEDLLEAEKEARLILARLSQLRAAKREIWDEARQCRRAVDWGDVAILLRAPAGKAEAYAKEFARAGIPLVVARGGFYKSIEISDLICLLQLLDNPLQDIPLLALLRSPMVGLSAEELVQIRLAVKGRFWNALLRWQEAHRARPLDAAEATLLSKVELFLDRYSRWRRLARQLSLSRCLETVLSETHYDAWILSQPRGEQRHNNVLRFLGLAQEFDRFQRQSLFRFLRFVEAQQDAEAEPEVPKVGGENAVRLMSIHQSKGLEFPVVVVADLGKQFNVADLNGELILDEQYGLCPKVKPPATGRRYPSLPHWLARLRQQRDLLGEEVRLLYVAMTRARDLLLLSGALTEKKLMRLTDALETLGEREILGAKTYADWLSAWWRRRFAALPVESAEGETDLFKWQVHREAQFLGIPGAGGEKAEAEQSITPMMLAELNARLGWSYPFAAATREPAKTTVTMLRRRATQFEDEITTFGSSVSRDISRLAKGAGVEAGLAHHRFLQMVSLDCVGSLEQLRAEAARLKKAGVLDEEEYQLLDFERIRRFWHSEMGRGIVTHRSQVRRELPFTARFAPNELSTIIGMAPEPTLEGEFIVVQGVADVAVMLDQEIWLLDFKTDAVDERSLAEKTKAYSPQLAVYALALARIYARPVTRCCLYFLAADACVALPLKGANRA